MMDKLKLVSLQSWEPICILSYVLTRKAYVQTHLLAAVLNLLGILTQCSSSLVSAMHPFRKRTTETIQATPRRRTRKVPRSR